jgi:hypothetical protein
MRVRCPICRGWFEAIRADAMTCSVKCRVARHRLLHANTPRFPNGPFDLVLVDLPLRWEGLQRQRRGPVTPSALLDDRHPLLCAGCPSPT